MTRRRIRIALGVVGGIVVLCLLAAVLLPRLVPHDTLRTLAETTVREQVGGEVALGEFSLKVFPRLRLVLGESRLAVTRDDLRGAGKEPGPLLSAQVSLARLEVDLALWPLLRKQLDFGQVTLIEPVVDVVTEVPADSTAAETLGDRASPAAPPAVFGLALGAVSVRDGQVRWREEGTGRQMTVRGWQQDLAAPDLGVLASRLQRLGGADLPVDASSGEANLTLDTRIAAIELAGFGETPPPPLTDVRLRAELSVPKSADRASLAVTELSLPGWLAVADGELTRGRLAIERLEVTGGEAATFSGTASLAPPPAAGPLKADLTGRVDLALILAQVEPWLPPRPQGSAPLPVLGGTAEVAIVVDLPSPPSLADAAAWKAARERGLEGRAELQATAGPITVTTPQLAEPVRIQAVNLTSDLRSAAGATRIDATGVEVAAGRLDAQAVVVLPPGAGPLSADVAGKVDLASVMALVGPFLPPRPADAAPLPELTGALDVTLNADLAAAPSLADTAAWAAAWRRGLPGRADLRATGGPVTVAVRELGEPLRLKTVSVVSDLRSRSGKSRLEATGLSHPVVQGGAVAEIVPAGANGVMQVSLALDRFDLDALAALAQQADRVAPPQPAGSSGAAGQQQSRARFSLVAPAWAQSAAAPAKPLPGELIPPDLAADMSATARELVFLKSVYTDVKATGTLRNRVFDVPNLTARLGEGTISGNARVDYAADAAGKATWNATVTKAPAGLLLKPYVPLLADLWTGELDAKATGGCGLADAAAILTSLTLAGEISGANGIIDLRQPLGGISRYLGDRQDLMRVVYTEAREHFEVKDGRVHLQDLRIGGKDTDWTGAGSIGLDGQLDLSVHVKLPAGFTPDLGDLSAVAEALRGEDGRIGLDFSITGDARSPSVGLDIDPEALMKSDAVKKEVEEGVKKGLGGLLDRLKGK
ncbi:MAG TPA: AsmA-like C-terminal region-containing protein [Candidatus Krumholzibacteria bacterium]|nr:AsmA-like C-terminal region-containing protein [Candidatus Krumholzibacteria bacterium]HPD72713.1 AsmA-like C-terminal region-containing protein [Candidatus Krumholzibacteria bacterium]HRY40355.1 AsmA-like C-terminal region-containing protein [Candidatus Krumholzibacteria bacterium]